MKRISQRVAFATVVLVVAIAGAAWAAGTITGAEIKNGSLTGKDIKNHSLTAADFKGSLEAVQGAPQVGEGAGHLPSAGASSARHATAHAAGAGTITGKDIRNSSLTGKDIKNHSLTKSDFKGSVRGPRGKTGVAGPQGPQGPAGPAGAAGFSIVAAQGDGIGVATAYCPAGTRPVSGGGIELGTGYLWVSGASIDEGGIGWTVAGDEDSEVAAFAYCSASVTRVTLPNGTAGRSALLTPKKIAAMRAAHGR